MRQHTTQFDGHVAFVTGAGRGIGRSVSSMLAEHGAHVGLVARSRDELDDLEREITARGGTAMSVPTDVGDPRQVDQALRAVVEAYGAIDLLINNAGVIWPAGSTLHIDPEDLEHTFAVNFFGPVRLTLAVVPGMVDRGYGRVVNLSSGAAGDPANRPGMNTYASTKAALEAHSINLAVELKDTGVTVNVLRPGSVDTPMQKWVRDQPIENIGEGLHDRFTKIHDEGRLTPPERPAQVLIEMLMGTATGEVVDLAVKR